MSDIISLLPDSVANQIAAGEVIQRPASVVKELVENSLDAGATLIQVVVEDAGKTLIQVVDNGIGMSATDARLSFERHATSKIRKANDLFSLTTMGFRGEALASIAAVAQVELRTKMKDAELGTCINIEGSKVVSQEPVACPVGSNFSVRNLFFNIPARRKFLKSNQTELTNIMTEFERVAMAHPDIAFTLYSGKNVMLGLDAGNFRQRIVGIFGRKLDTQLVPIGTETTLVRIHGFIGMPQSAKKKNAHQFFFVNGRYMRHPYFAKAVMSAYERLIPEGSQIPYFVHLEVDPSRIDVNIHPTKTEIKFEDDNAIFQILMASVREALGKYGAVPRIDFDVEGRPDIPAFENQAEGESVAPPQIHINTEYNPFESSRTSFRSSDSLKSNDRDFYESSFSPSAGRYDWKQMYDEAKGNSGMDDSGQSSFELSHEVQSSSQSLYEGLQEEEQQEWQASSMTDFMQYQGHYIVTPLNSGLALIDQHKAHIRILYEQYMRYFKEHNAASQRVLFPEMITLSPSESLVLERIQPQLHDLGFDLSPLGSGSYSICAVPVNTEGVSPIALVTAILADAVEGHVDVQEKVTHTIALALARKVAIPVGQVLGNDEMNQLVEQLFTCSTPNLTPDGQPTLVVIDPEKML